jgi:ribonuclease P protein component
MWGAYRLRKPWWRKFSKVVNRNRKVINPEFVIFYLPNQLVNHRFGISIPRKKVKKSSQRNYYKRQVKNILISFLKASSSQKFFPRHFDFVIIVRFGFQTQDDFSVKQASLTNSLNLILQKELSLTNKKIYD